MEVQEKQQMTNENELNILLSQWQTCVEMANSTSQRRDTMNNWFITINSGIMAFAAFTFDIKTFAANLAGISLCVLWIFFIRNYKELNTAKFDVIQKLEEKLPSKPFTEEWALVKSRKKYKKTTSLEYWLPATFLSAYVLLFAITGALFCINVTKGGN